MTDDQTYTLTLYALRYALDAQMRGGRAAEVARTVRQVWPGLTAAQAVVIRGELESSIERARSTGYGLAQVWTRLLLWTEGG